MDVEFLIDPRTYGQDLYREDGYLSLRTLLLFPVKFGEIFIKDQEEALGQLLAELPGEVGLNKIPGQDMNGLLVDACHDGKQPHQGF